MWSDWGSFRRNAVRPVRGNLAGVVVKPRWLVDKSEGT
jgi:hypothetical protein